MKNHDPAEAYRLERQAYWERTAATFDHTRSWGGYYHARLAHIYRQLVAPGQRVVELGCGQADLLAAVSPAFGVGIDFSPAMLERARRRHPELHYLQADVHSLDLEHPLLQEPFDVVILSDLLHDVWDVQTVLEQARRLCRRRGRVILNNYSRLWEIPLALAQKLGLARPVLQRNWLTVEDLDNLLKLADFEPIRSWQEIALPLPIPLLAELFNRYLVRLAPFNHLGLTNFILARPAPLPAQDSPSVSIVIPARNEAGNIPAIFARTPQIGSQTELIFVEGHSKDDTYQVIEALIQAHPEKPARLFRQTGTGKGDAVRLGFAQARNDVLMILDADLTVPPEDLPRFYAALVSGKGDFINGVRLVYPMEKQAMRFLNLLGNKFFSLAFSWLLGQPIKDTLCGTKVLWKSDYEKIAANRAFFGDFDPFGDFDLLFGAVKLNLKIVDLPIRYRERRYGATNIRRFQHGWLLLKMLVFAARRLKFT